MSEKAVARHEKNPFEGIDPRRVFEALAEVYSERYDAKFTVTSVKKKESADADAS